MPETNAEVVLVDDDKSVLRALSRQISLMGHTPVAYDAAQAGVEHVRSGRGDCLLLDLRMPEFSGLDVQEMLAGLPVPIVFISGQATIPATVQALQNGAVTFLEKPVDYDDLTEAIETALRRGVEMRTEHNDRAQAKTLFESLTKRQRQVFLVLITGASNKGIARELGIGERTVKAHRQAIMERLGADSIADIYKLAAELDMN